MYKMYTSQHINNLKGVKPLLESTPSALVRTTVKIIYHFPTV